MFTVHNLAEKECVEWNPNRSEQFETSRGTCGSNLEEQTVQAHDDR